MAFSSVLVLACLVSRPLAALVGFGLDMYNPTCAHACFRAIEPNMLSCSNHHAHGGHMHGADPMTPPECRAGDTAYLTTLAFCMSSRCARYHISTSRLEEFWERECTRNPAVMPKWNYGTAVQHLTQVPTQEVHENDVLNFTAVVPETAWNLHYHTLTFMEKEEKTHAKYGYDA